jgi:sugar lactone lactonase YvrE
MCYQGTQQGKLCTVDGDCAGSGTCHIGGNINNEEQCHAELSVPLGGLPGDTIADEVVGLCSTESNLHATQNGTFVSNWYGVGFVSTLAYDYVNDQLFEGNSSVVHGWTNTNYHTIQGPSTVAVGQSDLYSEGWSRLTGDQSTGIWNSGTLTNYVFTAQVNGIAFGPSGDMWVSDYSRVMKFDPPITTGKAASLVLCSTSFGPLVVNPGNSGKCSPTGVAVDSSGQVAVADGSRILLYQTPPIVNGQFADKVLGQTDFSSNACNRGSSIGQNTLCTVSSLAFDSNGNLYVADSGNNRVLIYQKGSGFINGQNAAMVLGQTNFTSSVVGLTQSQVNTVVAVTVDNSGNVAVVDRINRRILTYDNPLGSLPSITISATHVVGQANFTSNIEGEGTSNMAFPSGVAIKSSASAPGLILFITEGNLNGSRILEYTWPIATNGPAAMVVLGQPDFLTRFRSMATTNSFEIAGGAGGIAFTSTGGVWLADTGHNRILGWADKNAAHSGANADYVLGQAHSAQGTAESANEQRANRGLLTPSSTSLFLPEQMSIDASDNLYVADNRNDRVIMYPNPAEGTAATKVFGQTSLTAHTLSFPPTATSLFNPTLAYIDSDGALWIADTGASRVTYYPTPQSSSTATIVIGQSNLNAGGNGCSSPTATNLCNPYGIYHDIPNKRLFISDEQSAGTGRILVYNYSSLASGMSASFALGVPSGANNLTSFSTCPKTQSEGCGNGSLDIHPISGNLFVVASPGVIEYPAPFSAGSLPSRLFGSNTPTSWGLQGLGGGYINCQWNTGNGDQLKFAPDKHMWVFDNGSFQVSRVLIVLDPDITAPTPTNTPSVATPTPTKTATATVTWTQQPTNTPQTPSATPTGPIPTATITFTPINTAIPTPTPTIPACILPPTATPIKAVCIPTQTP